MFVLQAYNIKKFFADRLIIKVDELKVYSGDRIGIVGLNGSGKTTLLNVLSKDIEPDEGFVKHYCDIAYIRQFSDESINAEPKVLKEFDISGKTIFSGGEKTRVKLANALSAQTQLLFADEPTTNLDIEGIAVLKSKLSEIETFLLISHNRELLDDLCNKIIEIESGSLHFYEGNYGSYKAQWDNERQFAQLQYEKYIADKKRLEEALKNRREKAQSMKKAPKRMGNSEARLHKRKAQEKQEKINNSINSIKTRLEKLEVKEKPKDAPEIRLDFTLTNPPGNKI
ncbi:MAG TPA: ATP-binding cassette domain-containing protein, partial [Clostridia bacterium]|nr:ATP-binding cassette domain-containing protein [Clostridia bacterium]